MSLTGRDLAALCGQESVIVIRRPFVDWLGSVADALLLDQCLYWQDAAGPGRWWHRSDADMADRLCLTVYAVAKARESLGRWLQAERRGIPARMWYCLDSDGVAAAFADHVARIRVTSSANSDNLSVDSGEHSLDGVKISQRRLKATPVGADAGTGAAAGGAKPKATRAAKPKAAKTPKAPADPAAGADRRRVFGELCAAAGWSSADLTTGNRVQLAKLAGRILEEPAAERPTAAQLASIYDARHRELSAQLRRPAGPLSVLQFRQSIGAWLQARAAAAAAAPDLARLAAAGDDARAKQAEWEAQPATVAWAAMSARLRTLIPPATFREWLQAVRPAGLVGGVLTVRAETSMAADWINGRLSAMLQALAEDEGLASVRVLGPAPDVGKRAA